MPQAFLADWWSKTAGSKYCWGYLLANHPVPQAKKHLPSISHCASGLWCAQLDLQHQYSFVHRKAFFNHFILELLSLDLGPHPLHVKGHSVILPLFMERLSAEWVLHWNQTSTSHWLPLSSLFFWVLGYLANKQVNFTSLRSNNAKWQKCCLEVWEKRPLSWYPLLIPSQTHTLSTEHESFRRTAHRSTESRTDLHFFILIIHDLSPRVTDHPFLLLPSCCHGNHRFLLK